MELLHQTSCSFKDNTSTWHPWYLVDSSSTQIFVSEDLANKTKLTPNTKGRLKVLVASKEELKSEGQWKRLLLKFHGFITHADFLLCAIKIIWVYYPSRFLYSSLRRIKYSLETTVATISRWDFVRLFKAVDEVQHQWKRDCSKRKISSSRQNCEGTAPLLGYRKLEAWGFASNRGQSSKFFPLQFAEDYICYWRSSRLPQAPSGLTPSKKSWS